jgi:hypothetical protein
MIQKQANSQTLWGRLRSVKKETGWKVVAGLAIFFLAIALYFLWSINKSIGGDV